jgi:hypothetical protein
MRWRVALSIMLATALPVMAEDWTTTDGKTYKNVKVIKSDAVNVTILDEDGGATVPIANLPPDVQKKLNYDPSKAQAIAVQEADAQTKAQEQKALHQRAILSLRRIQGEVAQVLQNGFFVDNYEAAEVKGQVADRVWVPSRTTYAGSSDGLSNTAQIEPGHYQNIVEIAARPKGLPTGRYFVYTTKQVVLGDKVDMDVYPAKDHVDDFGQHPAVTDNLDQSTLAHP